MRYRSIIFPSAFADLLLELQSGSGMSWDRSGVKQLTQRNQGTGEMLLCRPLDAAGVMESMLEAHTKQLLPRLKAGDAVLAQFAEHCLECKVRILSFSCQMIPHVGA